MSISYTFKTKEDLVAALEAQRPAAVKADKVTLRQHNRDEVKFFKRFRIALRRASGWDYADAKKSEFRVVVTKPNGWEEDGPQCPILQVDQLDRAIGFATLLQPQKRYTVSKYGKYSDLWQQLTANVSEAKEAC